MHRVPGLKYRGEFASSLPKEYALSNSTDVICEKDRLSPQSIRDKQASRKYPNRVSTPNPRPKAELTERKQVHVTQLFTSLSHVQQSADSEPSQQLSLRYREHSRVFLMTRTLVVTPSALQISRSISMRQDIFYTSYWRVYRAKTWIKKCFPRYPTPRVNAALRILVRIQRNTNDETDRWPTRAQLECIVIG
jgi:hypothetical protein